MVTVSTVSTKTTYVPATTTTFVTKHITVTTDVENDITKTSTQTIKQTLTVTTTSTVTLPVCTNKVMTVTGNNGGKSSKSCKFGAKCSTQIVSKGEGCSTKVTSCGDATECATNCGNTKNCNGFMFHPSSKQCTHFVNLGSYTLVANNDYVCGVLQ